MTSVHVHFTLLSREHVLRQRAQGFWGLRERVPPRGQVTEGEKGLLTERVGVLLSTLHFFGLGSDLFTLLLFSVVI
jgi:hypothetical protein